MPGAKKDPETGLTQADETFCVLYVTGGEAGDKSLIGNGTACYRVAFKPKRAKQKSVNELASHKLSDIKIQSRIKALREKISERAEVNAAKALRETELMANARAFEILNDDFTLKPLSEWPEEARAALAGFDIEELFEGRGEDREHIGRIKKFKFWDKNAAQDRIFKHAGLFEKDNKQKADPIRALLEEIDARARPVVKS